MPAPEEETPEKAAEKERLSIALKGKGKGRHNEGATILAKGRGNIAEQILQIAFAQGVKVRTDSDLAEILSCLDIDSEIPIEALATVSSLLNRVYEDQSPSGDSLREAFNLARGDRVRDNSNRERLSPYYDPEQDKSAPKGPPQKP